MPVASVLKQRAFLLDGSPYFAGHVKPPIMRITEEYIRNIDLSAIRAPRGTELSCKGWPQEAALRMLLNNLDPEVAEKPEELIVYGGSGKAARNKEALQNILRALLVLEDDETLLIQSGKPVGILQTHPWAPRVLISNSMLVPKWADFDYFKELEAQGLIMYGQMTAGSWIYIGTQGIVQGTYETFAAAAQKHFGTHSLRGRLVVTAGLGGMGGAQPLAVTMNEGVALVAEAEQWRIDKRIQTRYLDQAFTSIEEAVSAALRAKERGEAVSIGVRANAVDLLQYLVDHQITPDLLTDQTSAHDPLNGYFPYQISVEEALELRKTDPQRHIALALESMARHVRLMLELQRRGAHTFDYGNNLRGQAKSQGVEDAFDFPGFVPAYVRPLFCEGKGPFRWAALSGDPQDIRETDDILRELFPENKALMRWLDLAEQRVAYQGLPARICWLGQGEREKAGRAFNRAVRQGRISAPLVIGRDHLDTGSVASPYRETEAMKDGSDAIADWPVLNALTNTASGATWVSFHHGGGVGIGYSLHAGMVVVIDGTDLTDRKLQRLLRNDPGLGVIRHADAGYELAQQTAQNHHLDITQRFQNLI